VELLLFFYLNPWSRVLLEKLIVAQLVKKFPAFYGTRSFITVFTTAGYCPYPDPDASSLHSPILIS